jgi:hypothetical protein
MAEDPIKLFATRAERYPEPTEADVALGAGRAALAAIPFVGGSITEVLSLVLAPAVARRRDIWFKELADGLEEAERKIEEFTIENLTQDEAFVSAMIQASRIAMGTHQQEKREYLRNALLNVALGKFQDEVKQQIFLNAIEAFAPAHVHALILIRGIGQNIPWDKNGISLPLRTYGAALGVILPDLKGQASLIGAMFNDLRNRGFSNLSSPDLRFPQGDLITNLGVEFLNFIVIPKELSR